MSEETNKENKTGEPKSALQRFVLAFVPSLERRGLGEDYGINKKILFYYSLIAFVLLVFLKLLASDIFLGFMDFVISFLPMIVIVAMVLRGYLVFHKHHQSYTKSGLPLSEKETLLIVRRIRREIILETLGLLLITLLFYVLYSPSSWEPVWEALGDFGKLLELDNFFLILAYGGILYVAGAIIYVAYKYYLHSATLPAEDGHLPSTEGRKSSGKRLWGFFSPSAEGESPVRRGEGVGGVKGISSLIHRLIYRTFIIFFALFAFSALAYPGAYQPITDLISNSFVGTGYYPVPTGESGNLFSRLRKALTKTGANLTEGITKTNSDLVTTLEDTKTKLDDSITASQKDLKLQLEQQLISSSVVVEGPLVVTDTATVQDIIPESDTAYDLGSTSKSWNSLYVHSLHGASAVTIGTSGSSHGVNASDDLVVSGDAEVKGTLYMDSSINADGNKIVNVASPTQNNDAANKTYVDNLVGAAAFIQRSGSTISPTNSGDSLNMNSGNVENVTTLSVGTVNSTNLNGTNITVVSGTVTGTITAGTGAFTSLTVTDNTLVANLNADLLDNQQGAYYLNTDTVFNGDVSGTYNTLAIGLLKVTNEMLAGSITAAKLIGTDIATLGTITTGTWHGTSISDAYVDNAITTSNYLPLAGGTMSGAINLGSQNITNGGVITGAGFVGSYLKPAADSTTAIQLQKSDGTNVLNVDTTNGRVGIGTTSPGGKFVVKGGNIIFFGNADGVASQVIQFEPSTTAAGGTSKIYSTYNTGASEGSLALGTYCLIFGSKTLAFRRFF